jgi:hypothetical protein
MRRVRNTRRLRACLRAWVAAMRAGVLRAVPPPPHKARTPRPSPVRGFDASSLSGSSGGGGARGDDAVAAVLAMALEENVTLRRELESMGAALAAAKEDAGRARRAVAGGL